MSATSNSSPQTWLLTGVTSGLGASTLHHMLHTFHYPPTHIIATSRTASNAPKFTSLNLGFRHLDYTSPLADLTRALQNVDNFFFVASPERDTVERIKQHANVIAAVKAAGVGKVWYNSLAFGGYGEGSEIGFQQAHYETERLLVESGVDFVSLRAGVYADAFPLFLNWYSGNREVVFPKGTGIEGTPIAFASREELGEAHASLFARGGLEGFPGIVPRGETRVVLLTGGRGSTLVDLVGAIDRAKGTETTVRYLEREEEIQMQVAGDEGGKGRQWFELRVVFLEGCGKGDAATVDPTMGILLGREPEDGMKTVERLLKADPEYWWHQNQVVKK